jgi:hypothetical protein
MNTTTTKTAALITAEGRGSLVWPRFTPGLLLLDEDLTAGVDYTRELSRLLFRNLFGCGVICGLTVTGQEATGRCLTVAVDCGLALDCIGDPVQVRQPKSLTIMATCEKTLPGEVWVALRRCEHECMPRELACPPEAGGQSSAKTRAIDCYEIAVLDHRPAKACGCPGVVTTPGTGGQPPPTPGPTGTGGPSTPTPGPTGTGGPSTPTPGPTGAGGQATPSPTPTVAGGASTTPARGRAAAAAAQPTDAASGTPAQPDCYKDHKDGVCACDCCAGSEWVLLAKLTPPAAGSATTDTVSWNTDYSVRRFIRPMLLPDPKLASA